MSGALSVLDLLADGGVHSGRSLAAALGQPESSVARELRTLKAWGVPVRAVRGRGYRLSAPVHRLQAADVRAELADAAGAQLRSLAVEPVVGSTNTELLARGVPPPGRADVLIACCCRSASAACHCVPTSVA
jgi:BirA family transcriptional regulator, biotin operon repressor / biotin---[acetyl-CoA-carboxylase] ligase